MLTAIYDDCGNDVSKFSKTYDYTPDCVEDPVAAAEDCLKFWLAATQDVPNDDDDHRNWRLECYQKSGDAIFCKFSPYRGESVMFVIW